MPFSDKNPPTNRTFSLIFVELRSEFTADEVPQIWDELRRKVNDVKPYLPDGVSGVAVNDDFGDVYGIFLSLSGDGYTIDQVVDGETVAHVLEYVQYDPKKLVRRLEIWVSKAIKEGRINDAEGKEFISNYRAGLYGYTYLE